MEAPSDVLKQLQHLNLTGEVKRLIWNVLVSRGLYAGNPYVPEGYDYREPNVLNMTDELLPNFINTLGLNLKVNELIAAKRSEAFSFTNLPPELQTKILGRVSPTAREGVLVSRTMKDLADVALVANIRNNDLIDPTIGMPERAEYFKLDTFGNGDYFAPKPGLWKNLKEFRTTNVDDMISKARGYRGREYPLVPVLIYGSFRGSEFGDVAALRLGLSVGTNKFVSLGYTSHDFQRSRTFRTVVNGTDPKQILPPANIGPVAIGLHDNRIRLRDIPIGRLIGNYLNNYQSYEAYINIGMWETDKRVPVQLILLDKATVDQAKLILPSLRDDVVVI